MPNIDRANKHNQTCSKAGEDENSTFSPAFDSYTHFNSQMLKMMPKAIISTK